jgi:membrane protease YdiL (CAAX protease family)
MQETYQKGPNPLSQLLIAIGIVLINIYIFNMFSQWIGLKLFDADVAVLLNNELFNELTTSEIHAIRFSQFFTSFGGFIMSSFVIMQVFQQNPWEYMRLNTVPSTKFILLGVVLFISLMPAVQQLLDWNTSLATTFKGPIMDMFNDLEKQNNRMYELLLKGNQGYMIGINLIVLALVPAIGEELFFRGILYRIFENWTGKRHAAVWLTSFLFALIHFQIFKLLPMALLAGIFAYLLFFSNSLWLGIGLHFLNNALVVVAYALQQSGVQYKWLKDDYAFPVIVAIVCTIIGLSTFYYLYKNQENNGQELSE